VNKIIINLRVAAYEQSNVVGERFSADDSNTTSSGTGLNNSYVNGRDACRDVWKGHKQV